MSICMWAPGAVIIIRGQPTALEYRDELYFVPQGYTIRPETTNLFITMDGVNKVCFLNTQPPGLFEQVSQISILLNGFKTEWNCFPYIVTISEDRP